MRFFFISPDTLSLPDEIAHGLRKQGVRFSFHRTIEEVIGKVDIFYMTRIQKERMGETAYEETKNLYRLTLPLLEHAKKNLKILHALPRVNEIDTAIDATPFAYYFQQAENGIYMRQALLASILKEESYDSKKSVIFEAVERVSSKNFVTGV